MFQRFTSEARTVVVLAQEQARRLGHDRIGTEHLLLALLDPAAGPAAGLLTDAGAAHDGALDAVRRLTAGPRPAFTAQDAEVLESIGIDLQQVLGRLEALLGPGALATDPAPRRGLFRRRAARRHIPFSPRAKKVLELSLRESIALKSGFIGTEHLLLALVRERGGLAATVLAELGVDPAALRREALRRLDRAA